MNVTTLKKREESLKKRLAKTRNEIQQASLYHAERIVEVIGEAFLQAREDQNIDEKFYSEVLDTYVSKKRDRKLLGLDPAPATS